MENEQRAKQVSFVTLEDGGDLIVSFAISAGQHEVHSLTLLRTPKYEVLLPPYERGVSVSYDGFPPCDDAFLERIRFVPPCVEVYATGASYTLDVSAVEEDEIKLARRILQRMNFDRQFLLEFK
ncbi:MAG TPA: hypothetical protein VF584_04370 [Longimicrobium sp.]|jgi:hypothetical protein